jgi:fructuronate reductase
VWTVGAGPDSLRVIGSIKDVLVAPDVAQMASLTAAIASPRTRLVTLTITEKGYCCDMVTGSLQEDHPDIIHDLTHPDAPRSAPGILALGLRRRMAGGGGAITVLSCDNLTGNGQVIRGALTGFAARACPPLATWLADNVRFPRSVVDRIVPPTTAAELTGAAARLGCRDAAVVVCEPFSQWVIEDDFAADRPRWEDAGALIVPDVGPYETAKLRLLNGAHSVAAHLGLLGGFTYVHEAIAHPVLLRFVRHVMDNELSPADACPAGLDLDAYKRRILERFANAALRYPTVQVASDGSRKLPVRLLGAVRERLAAGARIDGLCLTIAAWIRCCGGLDDHGAAIDIADPLAERLRSLHDRHPDAAELVEAVAGIGPVFGDLGESSAFKDQVARWVAALRARGAVSSMESLLATPGAA